MNHWSYNSIFYHIYPLGLCGAPDRNDFVSPAVPRLDKIREWIPHLKNMNINALYLGPLLESTAHGYDTADYYKTDRRLGTNETLKGLVKELHNNNIKVVLDGVFNHTGRDFWAFRDIQRQGANSLYRDWYAGIDFNSRSPYGDNFSYEGWNGHYDLAKLNLTNPEVKEHLFGAVKMWISEFGIDGLRLDAADCVDISFWKELAAFTESVKPGFWLMGEIIHGDYRTWANDETLDSVTNYECYKGLYSSHNDKNYFEIAYSLNRQSGEEGIYKNIPLYNFADNHDVNRIGSTLEDPADNFPLHILLFTMPGIPSLYYGSEFGITGIKENGSDAPLRPELDLSRCYDTGNTGLLNTITNLAGIRKNLPQLKYGNYRQLHVDHRQFIFARERGSDVVITGVNSSAEQTNVPVTVPYPEGTEFTDLLNGNNKTTVTGGKLNITIWPKWGFILKKT